MTIRNKNNPSLSSNHLPGKRIVLFLDILGFRDLIARMPTNPDLYNHIKKLLETFQQEIQEENKKQTSRLYPDDDSQLVPYGTQFSDSIVLSFPYYPETCDSLATRACDSAMDILGRLYEQGIFARGGIACGWMYHDQKLLLGGGLVSAYELESRVAHVPRIVVVDEVVKMMPDYQRERLLRKDSDGIWFVRPFSCLLGGLDKIDVRNCEKFRNDMIKRFLKIRKHVQEGLEQANLSNKPDLLAKYQWLVNQFNVEVEDIFQGINSIIGKIKLT